MNTYPDPTMTLPRIPEPEIENPTATLRELVDRSVPEPRQTSYTASSTTPENYIDGLSQNIVEDNPMARLVNLAATLPGNQMPFIDTSSGPTGSARVYSSIAEELDAHIFNRRLLIKLYDADHPNPEASHELHKLRYRQKYYTAFASSSDLIKLDHIGMLDHFLAGAVSRCEIRKEQAAVIKARFEEMQDEQKKTFDAIKATWPEPRFNSLEAYMSHQESISEKICDGTVDMKDIEHRVSLASVPSCVSTI